MTNDAAGISRQFVSFFLGEELFGIDIKLINEVNPNTNIIPVPLAKSYIRGYANVRGQVVLVIDLAVMFGKASGPLGPCSHIVLFKTKQDFQRLQATDLETDLNAFGDKPAAILVDAIGDVIGVEPGQVEKPTEHINTVYSAFVDGMVKTNEELLIIINPARILMYREEPAPV